MGGAKPVPSGPIRRSSAGWTAGPAGTQTYAIIMQDTDAVIRNAPILHWTMVNIPASTTKLEPGMSAPPVKAMIRLTKIQARPIPVTALENIGPGRCVWLLAG